MGGSGWWFFAIFILIAVANHFWLVWRRNQIQDSIQQSIEFGNIETWVQATEYRYRILLFAHRRDFRAKLFVTEKAIYVFKIVKLLGIVRIYHYFQVVFISGQDVSEIANKSGLLLTGKSYYRVDSLHINGRQIDLVFSNLIYAFGKQRRIQQFQYVFSDVRDNDAYRNFLRLQRYHQRITQQQRMQQSKHKR